MAATKPTPKKRRAWQPIFLRALRETGMVVTAAAAAKIHRATAYTERQRNEAFAQEWEAIEDGSTDELEVEAKRRAINGSDVLLIFLLKSRKPDVYRDNVKVEHGGQVRIGEVDRRLRERVDRIARELVDGGAPGARNGSAN